MKKKLQNLIICSLLLTACSPYQVKVNHDIPKANSHIDELVSQLQNDRKRLVDYLDTSKAIFPNADNLPSGNDLGNKIWQPPKAIKIDAATVEKNLPVLKNEEVVKLDILISENGRVIDRKVYESTNQVLNNSALLSSKNWEFLPAMLDGKPCKSTLTVPLVFKLD